ncbi:MAG: hypothetical protein RBR20_05790 [Desulfobacterales bacterium]|jgi:hypothetical protein|nr:hypothetical protein [Desulfobacteraceae bacterium]MDY0311618.1 hypothetical protein [Desulfobacterales bacterium]
MALLLFLPVGWTAHRHPSQFKGESTEGTASGWNNFEKNESKTVGGACWAGFIAASKPSIEVGVQMSDFLDGNSHA